MIDASSKAFLAALSFRSGFRVVLVVDARAAGTDVPEHCRNATALMLVLDGDSCSTAWFGAGKFALRFQGRPYTVTINWDAVWRAAIPDADIVLWRDTPPAPQTSKTSSAANTPLN